MPQPHVVHSGFGAKIDAIIDTSADQHYALFIRSPLSRGAQTGAEVDFGLIGFGP